MSPKTRPKTSPCELLLRRAGAQFGPVMGFIMAARCVRPGLPHKQAIPRLHIRPRGHQDLRRHVPAGTRAPFSRTEWPEFKS